MGCIPRNYPETPEDRIQKAIKRLDDKLDQINGALGKLQIGLGVGRSVPVLPGEDYDYCAQCGCVRLKQDLYMTPIGNLCSVCQEKRK